MLMSVLHVYSTDGHFSQVGEGSLRVDGLMEEDGGQYTCRASNLEDSIDSDVTLTVQGDDDDDVDGADNDYDTNDNGDDDDDDDNGNDVGYIIVKV